MGKRADIEYSAHIFGDGALNAAARTLPHLTRKIRWNINSTNPKAPRAIVKMKEAVLEKFSSLKINTAIIKRYSVGEDSGAYILHRDPDEFATAPLILITLFGQATTRSKTTSNKDYP